MLFFLAFFTIYLAMHVFVWSRFCVQLKPGSRVAATGYAVCVLLALSPVLAHLIPVSWPKILVYSFWQFTFTWLGVIFYLFFLQLSVFLLKTVLRPFIGSSWPRAASFTGMSIVILALAIVGYGFYEASKPVQVVKHQFESEKITRDIRLVFLSDLHLGVQKSSRRLGELIQLLEHQDADLIIFGGDLVNDHLEWLEDEALQLKGLTAPLGKFGVLGNHEFYPGLDKSLALFRQSEIAVLDDRKKDLESINLTLIGVTDPTPYPSPREHQEETTRKLLKDIRPDRFNLLISHRPWGVEHAARAGVDLHLAGHTHNGQIFPFRYFVRLQFDHVYGLYQNSGTRLIVTSGAGSWGPPIRVLAPAEIVVVDILARNQAGYR
ncbi:metallophosphoesterase [Desulfonatronovibrio hydrogenovorans]|uniref:metallophosphoesterase n=1 Tax=Desulfonatronovibrio hydrogenovorans TaxID=53245 RepID=UPI000491041B|nr:metallophosphoesterase [Desulfonatronovibrio hydrogenovorans]